MKTGFGSFEKRLESAKRRESGPPERMVVRVVSKSFPPTLSFMRSVALDSVVPWEVLS
ncbi:hypothetical protein A2U01_0087360, partial [Trifolium medium]|nr:hypothetical protein [Trifolium medium]